MFPQKLVKKCFTMNFKIQITNDEEHFQGYAPLIHLLVNKRPIKWNLRPKISSSTYKRTELFRLVCYLPTILIPSTVFKRTTCSLEAWPVFAAKTFSTLLHTLKTDPAKMLYVRRLRPTSQSRPRVTFLQFPRLKGKITQYYGAVMFRKNKCNPFSLAYYFRQIVCKKGRKCD